MRLLAPAPVPARYCLPLAARTRLSLAACLLGLAACLLLPAQSQAQVTFRLVGEDAQRVRYSLDIDRIEPEADMRRFWVIRNLRARNEVGAVSTRTRQEINCAAKTMRDLFTVHHQGVNATGPIIITLASKESDFQPFTEESLHHRLWGMVCLGL
ncbi:MAG: surface-adhesin E family protein [Burkholderiaceae bacterium]